MIEAGGMEYTKKESLILRDTLAKMRNDALATDNLFDPDVVIVLSHTIAWMREAINIIYKDDKANQNLG